MNFTPDGKHLFFYSQTTDTAQSFVLVVDGKPATPAFDMTPYPFFSADGSRWGVLGTKAGGQREPFLVIDGATPAMSAIVRSSLPTESISCACRMRQAACNRICSSMANPF